MLNIVKMESDNKKILKHLLAGLSLTKAEAYRLGYGISINSRISELRQMGYPIKDQWMKRTNDDGKELRFKAYFMNADFIREYNEQIKE